MTHELILTSVAQGLDPNEHGFCPVAADAAISPCVVQHLYSLSNYRHLMIAPDNSSVAHSPVAYSHYTLPGKMGHVLSRMADTGLDYRGQPNTLAHHVVFEGAEYNAEGPAWLLALPGFHVSHWNEPPVRFVQGRPVPTLTNPASLTRRQQIARQCRWLDPLTMLLTGSADTQSESYLAAVRSNDDQITLAAPPTTPCPLWKAMTGDAGWGGMLAETAFTEQPVVLIYNPEQNILPLFVEALALLPPYFSWQVTFCTYFTGLPEKTSCQWKGVVAGSDEAKQLARDLNNLVLDLTVPMGEAFSGIYINFARLGQEHMLPLDAEESAVAVTADTKFDTKFGEGDTKKETDKFILSPVAPAASPKIQLPQKRTGLLELFLRRSSRFQFYFLYSMMFLLVLFLLVLAVDQVSDFGIVRTIQSWSQFSNLPPLDEQDEENVSELDSEAESDLEKTEPDKPTDTEIARKAFEENRKTQREPLFLFWETFAVPDCLPLSFPVVRDNQIDVPEKKMFGELHPLYPFGSALELRFIPLFDLPDTTLKTSRVLDALPDLVWQVEAVDTRMDAATPMFRFALTESGLEMDWEPEGLNNQHLYDTILSSLGFLQWGVADSAETVEWKDDMIALFAPKKENPINVFDLAALPESETPEYVTELPFASELWQNVFAEMNPPHRIVLEVRAEPAGDEVQIKSLSPSECRIEVLTAQQVGRTAEGGGTVFENITVPFLAAASLEQVVWKGGEYAEWLESALADIESQKSALEKEISTLQKEMFSSGRDEADLRKRIDDHKAEQETLIPQLEHMRSILEKLPEAYHEIGQDASSRFHYSVFLESLDGKRSLRVLTTVDSMDLRTTGP